MLHLVMECLCKLIKCEGADINTTKMGVDKPDNLSRILPIRIHVLSIKRYRISQLVQICTSRHQQFKTGGSIDMSNYMKKVGLSYDLKKFFHHVG
jgi:hypothetical protein